jgi:pilus assembly protein CpaE
MAAIVDLDPAVAESLRSVVGDALVLDSLEAARRHIDTNLGEDTIIVGPSMDQDSALLLAQSMRVQRPSLGVILVRKRVDTAVLAAALRMGVRDVVEERDLPALAAAVNRSRAFARELREQTPESAADLAAARGQLVTVFSAKGGCGKTTLSTNLAAALADGGQHEVVLVDLDLAFGDVAVALQLFPKHTIADAVAVGEALDESALRTLLTPHSAGLSVLSAPMQPGVEKAIDSALVSRILTLLKEMFDFVVVDTPPAFDDQVLAAFDASDSIALVATLDIPALKNLKLTLETLDLLDYPRERWNLVLNRADSKVGLSISEVEKTMGHAIGVQIPSSRDVPATINRGVPIVLDDPKHPVSRAIQQVAESVVDGFASNAGSGESESETKRGRRGRRGRS